jgi:aldose sugar dehydrogenase
MEMKLALRGAAALAMVAAAAPLAAQSDTFQSQEHAFRVATVAEGFQNPWGLAFLPNGDLLVTERPGRLRLIRNGVVQPEPVAGIPAVHAAGQGGLMDVAIHPQFAQNNLVYVSYSKPGPDNTATTAVIRGRLEGNQLTGVEEIFEADAWTNRNVHFGSRLVFDRDGYLFVTVGDRGVMEEAQNLSNHQGTINRLHDDGRIPEDNPFVGQAGAQPSIYTYGNRSPQGLTIHPVTGQLWGSEHGPRGGDEINLIQAGHNYGWPVVTYGINYNMQVISELQEKEGMESPLYQYTPSIATSGIAIYDGDRFPNWRGNVFIGALALQHVSRVVFEGTRVVSEERLLDGFGERIRDVRSGPDGYIYLLTDSPEGRILRLEPAS